MTDLQILAITRFAYPGLGGFQIDHDTVVDRQAFLWENARMEARFRSLEHVSLRTLAAQTDGDFRTIILTGDTLPEPWRARVLSLASGLRGAEVVFHPPEPHRDAIRNVVLPRIDPDGPPVMQFRHDDDDGVARRFVSRAREIFADARALFERTGRMAIDFNRGLMLNLAPTGPMLDDLFSPHLGVAQPIFLRPDNPRTALHFPHHRVGTIMPSVTIPDVPMWLRGVDGTNDSRVKGQMARLKPADEEQRRQLSKRFGLDLDAIARSF